MKELFNRVHEFLTFRQLDDLQVQAEKLVEEQQELWEALAILQEDDTPENRHHFAEEAVDNIIVCAGLVAMLGEDGAEIFEQKMAINGVKYSLGDINNLINQGFSPQEACHIMKDKYNGV